jgi:hypothetical protein
MGKDRAPGGLVVVDVWGWEGDGRGTRFGPIEHLLGSGVARFNAHRLTVRHEPWCDGGAHHLGPCHPGKATLPDLLRRSWESLLDSQPEV